METEFDFWSSAGGSSDAKDFLNNLKPTEKSEFFRTMRRAQNDFETSLRSGEVKKVNDVPRIYQLKFPPARFLFHIKNQTWYLLVGFYKKEQKMRPRYLKTAIRRSNSLYNQ